MDRIRKALLGAAGILALTASGQKSADAAITPDDMSKPAGTAAKLAGTTHHGDPLFELMAHTNGSFQQAAIETGLRAMLANPSAAQLETVPALVDGLAGLGAPANIVARSRELLIELVSNASNVDDDAKSAALDQLQQAKEGTFKLAKEDHHRRRRRPNEVGEVGGRAPDEIGQTGGASSDIRLKQDISLVGRLENGLGLYRFSYIGDDKAYVGVMAQEVEAIMPEAVVSDEDGFLRVHYDMLGISMQTWEEWITSDQKARPTRH